MPTRVWLMRHAETADPAVFHGAESDIDLSERGRRMVRALAPFLASLQPDVVVASGMRRAIATAQPIAEAAQRLPLRIEERLHERRVGILQGQPHTPEHPLWTETIRRWTAGETHFTTPGAESFNEIRQRVFPIWQRVTSMFAGRKVVVVAHGMVCKVLLLSLLPEWSVNRWRQFGPIPNLGISELVWTERGWQATVLNQVPHILRDRQFD